MLKKILLFTGCVGFMAALLKYMYDKGLFDSSMTGNSIVDDEYKTDNLSVSAVTNWFKTYNPDSRYISMIIEATKNNIKKYNMDKTFTSISEGEMFQVVYDTDTDQIKRMRMVSFSTMSESLRNKLNEGKGIIVVEG